MADIVLGVFDAFFIILDLEINLGIHGSIQIIVGDDFLGPRVHQLLGDIDLIHVIDKRNNPIETRFGKVIVFAEPFHQSTVRGPDNTEAQKEENDEYNPESYEINHVFLLFQS